LLLEAAAFAVVSLMPTNVVSASTMDVGKKGSGKHWTKDQVAARQAAADKIKRSGSVELAPPGWVTGEARKVWDKKISEVAGLNATNEMLDNLDAESLGTYCVACAQYGRYTRKKKMTHFDVQEMQSWGRLILTIADKLGFTPTGRARLVKKSVDPKNQIDQFGKDFD